LVFGDPFDKAWDTEIPGFVEHLHAGIAGVQPDDVVVPLGLDPFMEFMSGSVFFRIHKLMQDTQTRRILSPPFLSPQADPAVNSNILSEYGSSVISLHYWANSEKVAYENGPFRIRLSGRKN